MSTKFRPGIATKPFVEDTATTEPATSSEVPVVEKPQGVLAPLEPGSTTAKVLASVWRGAEYTKVDSPPGGGKTSLIVTVASHLATRAHLKILIVSFTRAQVVAFAHRLVAEVPVTDIAIALKDVTADDLPQGYNMKSDPAKAKVTVATLAKAKYLQRESYDLIIVDEAYQSTHAAVTQAASGIAQILMVGDPGQIGPVVTVDTSIWAGLKDAPHLAAPLVTMGYDEIEQYSIGQTYRLGAHTAKVIAPIYPFEFASARPDRIAVTAEGVECDEIESIEVAHSDEVDNLQCLESMVDRAESFVGGSIIEGGTSREITAEDVMLIVSRNSQVSILTGMAASRDLDFTIGTADRLQGGEWPIVVALDAMYGSNGESEHNQSLGRLCVMLSRHTAHLTWLHDDSWVEATKGKGHDKKINRQVREQLVGTKVRTETVDLFDDGF